MSGHVEAMEPRVMLSLTDPDPTFGGTGSVTLPFTPDVVSVQPNGDVLAAKHGFGTYPNPVADVKVADVAPDGSVRWVADLTLPVLGESVQGMAIGPDGRVVVGGELSYGGQEHDAWFSRINANGTVDTSFNARPEVGGLYVDFPTGVGFEPDGSIVAVGNQMENYHLSRFTGGGANDPSFTGSSQFQPNSYPSESYAWGLLLEPDGKVVVIGTVWTPKRGTRTAVARMNADGSYDDSFGSGGLLKLPSSLTPTTVRGAANGDLLISAGGGDTGAPIIAAVTPAGALDAAFASGGILSAPDGIDSVTDLKTFPDGTFLVLGTAGGVPVVVKFTAAGTQDTSFGINGVLEGGAAIGASTLSFTPDSKLLAWTSGSAVVSRWLGATGAVAGDVAPPAAKLNKVPKVPEGARYLNFSVTYRDFQSGVNGGSVAPASVIVHFGKNRARTATLVSVTQTATQTGSAVTAAYAFRSPTGRWNAGANGKYVIEVLADSVRDVGGNAMPATVLGTLGVAFKQ